ncbi:GNAT family N-acetyltransferase [Actinosynnema sp. NPDC050436]|uniref:GNAT family N-acetyltransferase n=1 Tax=Actinosynnema sp. NPDC050436 TaxID=3155659 RepID=UPI0033C036B8
MAAIFHDDIHEFWRLARPLYETDPVRNSFALAFVAAACAAPEPGSRALRGFTLHDGDEVVGAAFRNPDRPAHISGIPSERIGEVASLWHAAEPGLAGVCGPRSAADAFAAEWLRRSGRSSRDVVNLGYYRLGELVPPVGVPGASRVADRSDLPLLTGYWQGFQRDTGSWPGSGVDELRDDVLRWLDLGYGFLLWEVAGEPVALAVVRGPVGRVSRVAVVYTPPEVRGRGYGSAATTAAVRWAVGAGAEHVVLNTDLHNATSNALYRRLGFQPEEPSVELAFTGP